MVFNSIVFGIFFVCVWTLLYFFRKHDLRRFILLGASLTFYGWWDWRFILLIIVSILIDYSCALAIEKWRERSGWFLLLSLAANLGILGYFKYLLFLADIFSLELPPGAVHIILPIGISFYTFQSISYTIDVYRKNTEVIHSPIDLALYVTFFPQLVAGPIVRAGELVWQLKEEYQFTAQNIERGIPYLLAGLVCKVVVADGLHPYVAERFTEPGANALQMLLSGQLYMVMLYYDFAGYSLMAIGLARLMGIGLPQNFRSPFAADSITEFWQKWHMSLGRWLRDYVFQPSFQWIESRLNRRKVEKQIRIQVAYAVSVILLMSVMGLWHGAHLSYVLHGFFYGLLIVADRTLFHRLDKRAKVGSHDNRLVAYTLVRRLYVFWVFGASALLFNFSHIPSPEIYFADPWSFAAGFGATDGYILAFVLFVFALQNLSRDDEILVKLMQGKHVFFVGLLSLLALYYIRSEPIQYVYFQF